jgi:hypothetical protein
LFVRFFFFFASSFGSSSIVDSRFFLRIGSAKPKRSRLLRYRQSRNRQRVASFRFGVADAKKKRPKRKEAKKKEASASVR